MSFLCDWCGEPIEADSIIASGLAELEVRGYWADGHMIAPLVQHYHAGESHEYARKSCGNYAIDAISKNEFNRPDAGYEWQLVPVVERLKPVDLPERVAPVLGPTPLADFGLEKETYMALTRDGIHTVEHVADMRRRGKAPGRGVGIKRLERLDRALVERGYLGSEAVA